MTPDAGRGVLAESQTQERLVGQPSGRQRLASEITNAIAREPDAFRLRHLKGHVRHRRRGGWPLTIKNKDAARDDAGILPKIAFVERKLGGNWLSGCEDARPIEVVATTAAATSTPAKVANNHCHGEIMSAQIADLRLRRCRVKHRNVEER
jgi:hypothetical protein